MTSESQAMPAAPSAPDQEHPNQFALLRQRRFAPFFWTQFSGAANDNLFKFAFTVMVTYQLSVGWLPPAMAGLVIGALFILPFLLFSATSGQLTDKYDKTAMIRFVKNLEIAIMLLAAWGFLAASVPVLLGCTFLMGLHSTLFGPVKFAYLPQVLSERELTGGNGMVEMGTFVAILLGNIVGGLLVAIPGTGHRDVAIACVALAIVGRLMAGYIPAIPATDPGLKINWNPVTETWRNLKLAHGNLVVFRSLLGISWMWFFGAVFLSQFPSLAKEVLHGNEQVASLLLMVFSIGIGTGSLLCEVLSRRHVEIGLVPLGAIGMSVFAIDLYFASRGLPASEVMGLSAFLAQPAHTPRPHHCGQQYFECTVHDWQLGDCRHAAHARVHHSADIPLHRPRQRGGGVLHLHAGARVFAAFCGLGVDALCLPLQGDRRRQHTHSGRSHPGLQPRKFCGCGVTDGGQSAPHAFPDGPPHFSGAGAGLVVQAGQGHPHCAAG